MGPFYCPGDRKVYLDLDFFRELRERFQAPGDFAEAYVIAHEIGHHVQNLMGTSTVRPADCWRTRARPKPMRFPLWSSCRPTATPASGRIMPTAPATSSKRVTSRKRWPPQPPSATTRLQKQARGYVMPDTFTHGTSAQRVRWFRTGLETGDIQSCETFAANPEL